MEFPKDLRYTENDEWIRIEGTTGTVGITDYAQDQLSDVVYLEINLEPGQTVTKGEAFGVVESVKAASDLYAPASGRVLEINQALIEEPERINADPYGEAWMLKIELSDPAELDSLMDAEAYEKYCQERSG